MIVERDWYSYRQYRKYRYYKGWFLFGFIPLFIKSKLIGG